MKHSITSLAAFLSCAGVFLSCHSDSDVILPPPNRAPVAEAGVDQLIFLPKDSIILDGTASKDPDGTITTYQWKKKSGPDALTIIDPSAAQTMVKNLVKGDYVFELAVTDNEGWIATDTARVTVDSDVSPVVTGCDGDTRQTVNVTLTQVGRLSEARMPYVAAAGSKIVFAGGPLIRGPYYYLSSAVDIYDVTSKTWSKATLSKEREGIAAASCGNKIFFAGGGFFDLAFANVDIYDVSTDSWTTTNLSVPRSYLAAAAVGNKVFFAGGFTEGWQPSSHVDIYDLTTDTWTTAELSQPRYNLTAVSVDNKIYFAGGDGQNNKSTKVDVFDNASNSWSTSVLYELSGPISGVAIGNHIYWGGIGHSQNTGTVEQWDIPDGSVTLHCLPYPRCSPTAAIRNDEVIFFTSTDWNNEIDFNRNLKKELDIYNTTTRQWRVGFLPHAVIAPAMITVNNSLYMAGGRNDRYSSTDKVYILTW